MATHLDSASVASRPRSYIERALTGSRFLTAVVVVAIALRAWTYLAGTSLWLDEILVTRNILGLSLGQLLTEPLYLDQVAPRGFLLAAKLSVLAFGETERALRLVAFLCAIASVFLFRRLAERTLDGLAVPFALVLFAIGVPFIKYGAEVKQYALDATATMLLAVLALDLRRRDASTRRLVLVGLVGFVVIWFSQASVLVMGGVGVALGIDWVMSRHRRAARALVVTMPLWAAASVLAIIVGLKSMTPSTRQFMDDFWTAGFLPLPFEPGTALRWLWQQVSSIFGDVGLLRYEWPWLFCTVALLGYVRLWRERRETALIVGGPVLVTIIAAVAHQYPLRGRLIFFLVPLMLLALAAGAERIRRGATRLSPTLGGLAIAALLVWPVVAFARAPIPYEIEHTRTILAHLQQNRRPGDVIHVFPLSRIGVLFYGEQYGLKPSEWTTAICDRSDTRAYVRDVDRYRGTPRVWVLSAGVGPFRSARPAVRGYLSTIGVKRDSLVRRSLTMNEISLELYDLSDSTRLRAATADSFPVAPMPTAPRPGCRPWVKPSPLDTLP